MIISREGKEVCLDINIIIEEGGHGVGLHLRGMLKEGEANLALKNMKTGERKTEDLSSTVAHSSNTTKRKI
jgi:hypothetical protein